MHIFARIFFCFSVAVAFSIAWGQSARTDPSGSVSQQDIQKSKLDASPVDTVRNFRDLKKFDQRRVLLIGRYQRSLLPRSARPGAPLVPTNKAEIVLEDKTSVFIHPLWSERSQRPKEELQKYQGKLVRAVGVVSFEQGDDPKVPQAARIVGPCIHLEELAPISPEDSLPVLRNKSDAQGLSGRDLVLIGTYRSETLDSISNGPIPKSGAPALGDRIWGRVQILLEDETPIWLFSPADKRSLRPSREQGDYHGKTVQVRGKFFGAGQNSPEGTLPDYIEARNIQLAPPKSTE